jgi:hypothetical protein
LLNEFIAVGQDEGTARALLDEEGKHDGFACAGGQRDERPFQTVLCTVQDSGNGFVLIRSGGKPKGARRNGSHASSFCDGSGFGASGKRQPGFTLCASLYRPKVMTS